MPWRLRGAIVRATEEAAVRVHDAVSEAAPLAAVVFVPGPEVWRPAGTPGGLSLLERLVKQMRKLEVREVTLLVPQGHRRPELPAVCGALHVREVPASIVDLGMALDACAPHLPEASLAVSADRLVDLRILRALCRSDVTTFVTLDGEHPEGVAWIRAADVRRWGTGVAAHAERLRLAELDRYSRELRGDVEPYVLRAGSPAERRRAWSVLLDHVQKRSLDLPGQYFDTPFENALVRRLAPTRVTPNQITLLTLLVAMGVAMLFARGWLRAGVLIALVVGVLDGVDGKLARLKLATSKLGELEHIGDFFYENAWYLTLALHFAAATGAGWFWLAGAALVACDLVDSLLYLTVQRRTGRMLDELSPFDRRFRAIAGRRNVYVMIFVAGFFSGHAASAYLAAVGWAVVTVAVHALRTFGVVARPVPAVG